MEERNMGPFELERQLGIGGMGIVYLSTYPDTDKKVAVKVLAPGLVEDNKVLKRFEREIEILKRLDHVNIVKYYGGGTEKKQRYYVMEFIDGGSLQEVLKRRTRLSWEQAIHVGRQVSSALEHAHNAGIVHRDLKPANLFLSKKGRLKLGDFGIARDTEATALTAAGKTLGTYAYMAPEQIQVGPPISRKTDIYALGCVLYECIVGETPFLSDNPMEMLMQHLQDDPYNVTDKVPECPMGLDQLIERMLAKDPDDRPHDALAVHTELGEIREKFAAQNSAALAQTVEAGQVSTNSEKTKEPEVRKKKKKKKKKIQHTPIHERTWFLATCLALLIAATIWFMQPRSEESFRDRWRAGMAGDEYSQRQARDKYLLPYLKTYPDGQYTDEAHEQIAEVNANQMEKQLRLQKSTKVELPFKRACVRAVDLQEEEGLTYFTPWNPGADGPLEVNPLPAIERWHALAEKGEAIRESDPEIPTLIDVCRNHHTYFRRKLISSSRAREFMRKYLLKTEQDFSNGEEKKALATWWYIYNDFKRVGKLADFAEYARQRYGGNDATLPPLEEPAEVPDRRDES